MTESRQTGRRAPRPDADGPPGPSRRAVLAGGAALGAAFGAAAVAPALAAATAEDPIPEGGATFASAVIVFGVPASGPGAAD